MLPWLTPLCAVAAFVSQAALPIVACLRRDTRRAVASGQPLTSQPLAVQPLAVQPLASQAASGTKEERQRVRITNNACAMTTHAIH